MPALASIDDVNRILGYTTGDDPARDAKVRANLDAVESWAEAAFWKISAEGEQVEVYFDIPEDATLYLPALDCTVTKVKIVPYGAGDDAFYYIFVSSQAGNMNGYDVTDDGRLILRPQRTVQPFEGARGDRFLRTYARVEVFYEGTGVVPRAVTEGIAYLTAGYHRLGPKVLEGITSERIGDYSYTIGGGGSTSGGENGLSYVDQANFFLRRFMRKQRVRVI